MDKYIFNEGYYHFARDLELYPDAWAFMVWSSRGQGKTYSALWYALTHDIKIAYLRRTKDDIDNICNENKIGVDLSPYKPINRDHGTKIKARTITKGIGGFYEDGAEAPVAYAIALSAAKSIKGFDMSDAEWLIFDEAVPSAGEITRRKEGEMILDLYMTIRRDREQRGRPPLRLIMFANAEDISAPVTNTLEIVDDMAEMNARREEYRYIKDRGILLHRIETVNKEKEDSGIFAAMASTAWGRKAFEGDFAHNDFSCVGTRSLKRMRPYIELSYNLHKYYIYRHSDDGTLYMCESRGDALLKYNLDREIDQKRFFREELLRIRADMIEGRMTFQKYSMYDLISNYTKIFDI